jgi:hypothetical protein
MAALALGDILGDGHKLHHGLRQSRLPFDLRPEQRRQLSVGSFAIVIGDRLTGAE